MIVCGEVQEIAPVPECWRGRVRLRHHRRMHLHLRDSRPLNAVSFHFFWSLNIKNNNKNNILKVASKFKLQRVGLANQRRRLASLGDDSIHFIFHCYFFSKSFYFILFSPFYSNHYLFLFFLFILKTIFQSKGTSKPSNFILIDG